MTFEEITQKFIDNNCYLSNGAGLLSSKWGVPKDIIKAARQEARNKIKNLVEEEVEELIISNDQLKSSIEDGSITLSEMLTLINTKELYKDGYKYILRDCPDQNVWEGVEDKLEEFIESELKDNTYGNKTSIVEDAPSEAFISTESKGKLKSKWFNGKTWCESYDYSEIDLEASIDFEKILNRVIKDANLGSKSTPKPVINSKYNLNVYLADQHIGAAVEHSLYSNYFDADIYVNRMDKVFNWIVKQANLVGGFDNITIFYLGDTFDGQDGFTVKRTHDLPQNMSNEEAFELGLKVNMKFLRKVFESGLGAKYNAYFVRESNHGGSMDYYLFKSLETWIKSVYEDVDCAIARSFLDYVKISNRTFIYTHGKDNKDMKTGLPLNLNDKTENFINQYIYENNIKGSINAVKADLHQNAINDAKLFSYRNVPSLFGSSKWIMSNFGITEPGVGWDMFNDRNEIFGGVIRFN